MLEKKADGLFLLQRRDECESDHLIAKRMMGLGNRNFGRIP